MRTCKGKGLVKIKSVWPSPPLPFSFPNTLPPNQPLTANKVDKNLPYFTLLVSRRKGPRKNDVVICEDQSSARQ